MSIPISQYFDDPNLAGSLFGDSWINWKILGKAIEGEPLNHKERAFLREISGRKWERKDTTTNNKAFKEVLALMGRRSGKTLFSSALAVYRGLFYTYDHLLAAGERASIAIISVDRRQSRTAYNYISGILHSTPLFEDFIVNETAERIQLKNRIDIEIMTSNYRSIRGKTLIMCIMDEAAFFFSEGSRPDIEIYRALKPSLATIPNGLIVIISTPYSYGLLYDMHRKFYAVEDDEILVVKAPTVLMNPTIDPNIIERELEIDRESAESEWLSEFRTDISVFLPVEWLENAVVPNRYMLESQPGLGYAGFVDMSGGANDFSVLSIGHREDDLLIQDRLEVVASPHNPNETIMRFAEILKSYRINEVCGDRFASRFVSDGFEAQGIRYRPSELTASDLYLNFSPLLGAGRAQLLDNQRLFSQFRLLERRPGRGGKDKISHPPRTFDDLANASAGMFVNLSRTWVGVPVFDWLRGAEERVIIETACDKTG